jgi:hypothetical protein
MNKKLFNKNILFFCPKFFGYEKEIKKTFEKQGANVDYFDERFGNTFFKKIIIRFSIKIFYEYYSNKYYSDIINIIKWKKYDYVLFIGLETITNKKLKELKNIHINSTFIIYMWDSLLNRKKTNMLMDNFNKIYSYDLNDCIINNKIKFLPLFYIDSYKYVINKERFLKPYEISFIGTAHSDRYKIIKTLQEQCKKDNISYYFSLYLQDKKVFYLRKIFDKKFSNSKIHDFRFVSISHNEIENISNNSTAILDIQHPKNSGLTMRTIEICLGLRKKLITTNTDIRKYDFYNENNILIIDRNFPIINKDFFKSSYEMLDEKIYDKYSINKWVLEILDEQ